jgi:hypothetical protein
MLLFLVLSSLGQASSLCVIVKYLYLGEGSGSHGAWNLQKLHLPVVSNLGQSSSLCALGNSINFIAGVGSEAWDMDSYKSFTSLWYQVRGMIPLFMLLCK